MKINSRCLSTLSKIMYAFFLISSLNAAAQRRDITQVVLQLKELQAAWHRAYVVSDSVKLAEMLSPEVRIVRTSGITLRKTQALNHYRTRDTTGLRISTVDQEVRADANLAVLTCHVKEIDKAVPYVYAVTDVFERKELTWQLLHSQWTILPGQWDKIEIDSTLLNSYAGTYIADDGKSFVIEAQKKHLFLRNSRGRQTMFVPRTRVQFFRPGEPDEIVFIGDGGGSVPAFMLYLSGLYTYVYRKK